MHCLVQYNVIFTYFTSVYCMCIILSIVHVFLYGWCFHLRSTCILFIYFYLFAWIMYCNCCVSLWLILFEGCLTVHLPHEIKWNANLMQQCNLLKFLSSTCFGRIRPSSEALDVNLSQYLTNWMHKICFTVSFISCLYMFRAHVLIIRGSKLDYTASGITTPIGVMIPEAV